MASNYFLENLNQKEADDTSVDYSKVDLVKQEQDHIYRLFNVSIIFGDKVKVNIFIKQNFLVSPRIIYITLANSKFYYSTNDSMVDINW